jgi:hypothetical protein
MSATVDAPKRRRWFRFSLRTLFVVFAVIAVWLGWNAYWVQQRQKMLTFLRTSSSVGRQIQFGSVELPWKRQLPITWRLFGAEPVAEVDVRLFDLTEDEKEYVRSLFPEARVRVKKG